MSSDPESNAEGIRQSLRELEARVSALEALTGSLDSLPGKEPSWEPPPRVEEPTTDRSPSQPRTGILVALAGRTLVALAGGFLLRAVTDAGVLGREMGTAVGLAYAFLWIVLAARIGSHDRQLSAVFHGLTASMIAFPLLFEATSKYGLLSPAAGAVSIGFVAGSLLAVAWWRRLHLLGWIVAGAGVVTSVALGVTTRALIPFAYDLLLLSLVTMVLRYRMGWSALAWNMVSVLNLYVAILVALRLVVPESSVGSKVTVDSLVPFLLVLVLLFTAVIGARALRGHSVTTPEIFQTVIVIGLGLGGAILVTHFGGGTTAPLAAVSALLSVGAYGVAFLFVDKHRGRRTNFLFYTTLALPLALVAAELVLDQTAFVLACATLALISAWMGGHYSRVTLNVHSAVYAVASATGCGLLAVSAKSFLGSPSLEDWTLFPRLVVLVVIAVCGWISAATHGRTWGRFARAPKLVLLALLVWCADGLLVAVIALVIPATGGEPVDGGVLATVRTGVIAATAVLLGLLGRIERLYEARWLVYPVLLVGAAKFVFDDFAHGRPLTLFVSLALFGGALILAPRLARGTSELPG